MMIKMEKSLAKLAEQIDDVKERLSDNEYLELMNNLKDIHDKNAVTEVTMRVDPVQRIILDSRVAGVRELVPDPTEYALNRYNSFMKKAMESLSDIDMATPNKFRECCKVWQSMSEHEKNRWKPPGS